MAAPIIFQIWRFEKFFSKKLWCSLDISPESSTLQNFPIFDKNWALNKLTKTQKASNLQAFEQFCRNISAFKSHNAFLMWPKDKKLTLPYQMVELSIMVNFCLISDFSFTVILVVSSNTRWIESRKYFLTRDVDVNIKEIEEIINE